MTGVLENAETALAVGYAKQPQRAALVALLELDSALAAVLRTTREPLVGQMRLTWWHEALSRLDSAPPPAEPVLVALGEAVLPHGITGASLATMVEGWEELLDADLTQDGPIARFAQLRGAGLFALAGQLLGANDRDPLPAAGSGWALADLARHLSDRVVAERTRALARDALVTATRVRWSHASRALGALAQLALLDTAVPLDQPIPSGSPGRVGRLLWHRLTGY